MVQLTDLRNLRKLALNKIYRFNSIFFLEALQYRRSLSEIL